MSKEVFISYSTADTNEAEWVRRTLEDNGISCWMAPESIPGGSDYATEIPIAIQNCKYFVLILSANAQKSKWVSREVDAAINQKKTVMPFMIENCALEHNFSFYLSNVQRYYAYEDRVQSINKMIAQIKGSSDSVTDYYKPESSSSYGSTGFTPYGQNQGYQNPYAAGSQSGSQGYQNPYAPGPQSGNPGYQNPYAPGPQSGNQGSSGSYPQTPSPKKKKSNAALPLVLIIVGVIVVGALCIKFIVPKGEPYSKGKNKTTHIEFDLEELITPFITGYNNFGYFDSETRIEGTIDSDGKVVIKTDADADADAEGETEGETEGEITEDVITYTLQFDEYIVDERYGTTTTTAAFTLKLDKGSSPIGDISIKANCNSLLSNEEILEFYEENSISGYEITYKNATFRVSTLTVADFERDDPQEHLIANNTRETRIPGGFYYAQYYRFSVDQSEYKIGTKTVKLSVVEDKRSGAEYVQPGILFEVYDENGELLGQGRYIIGDDPAMKYNVDDDDYGNPDYTFYDEYKLIPDFNQAELLNLTGILFNTTSIKEYTAYIYR